jgi:hypothetical protein
MKKTWHKFRLVLSRNRLPVSAVFGIGIFLFFLTNFPDQGRRTLALAVGIANVIGVPLTSFLIGLAWVGLMYLFLEFEDVGYLDEIEKQEDDLNKIYADAAVELQNKNTVKMDVWGKALLKARGNEELAKAKYIEIRVKEAKDSAKIEDLN